MDGADRDNPRRAPRPRDLSAAELGFSRQRPVAWLAPGLLAGTAVRVAAASMFGAILDKRELQAALPATVYEHDQDDELWFDFVADIGDGFDATYSMAWLLGQPSLSPDGVDGELPRGRVLVMGGDEVYPTPSWRRYEDRTKGPYQAALPGRDGEERPTLYALPGNHDWYDGLTAFLRLFGKGSRFGGWRTRQARSYFALSLPHRWWLFAIDEQLEAYLDEPQLRYFREAAEALREGDRVILCTSRPTWVYAARDPQAYDTVDYFIRKIIEPTGARVPVVLTGDLHHYARYQGEKALITCGGGGAFLYPTHHLPQQLSVPPVDAPRRGVSPPRPYELAGTFPDRGTSRRMGRGVFARLLGRNPGFAAVTGLLHALLMYAFVTCGTRVLTAPVITLSALVLGSTTAWALADVDVHHRWRHWLAGIQHGVAHLGLAALGAYAWWHLPLVHLPGPLPVLLSALIYLPVAGVVAAELTAAYLMVAGRFGVNVEESFAAQGIEDAKSFLRLHLNADGELTIYPIGLARAGRDWIATPDNPAGSSWITPARPLEPHLIEGPLHFS
ncbi:metallophosphoesterase [Actinocatenispora rupis]|uniref:Calcineurin-like phosphoesterase n=1 Tax=Actinocatenispora rupis TaxID=519421 RepID=A0A8J3NFN2_9ACTN|nr:metallophosphoesterase [Actinocatenispora rupis]GID15065.1 hypothetical protein Aru02nite_59540 [Actinocatenispora rupis]